MITNERSRVWVKRLPGILKILNSRPIKITGKEPTKALGLKEVQIKPPEYKRPVFSSNPTILKRPVGLDKNRLPPEVTVRYLLKPGEDEGGEKRRATDPVWRLEIYYLSRSVISSRQPVLYYLLGDGPKRGFVREELQVVSEDTELPSESVL